MTLYDIISPFFSVIVSNAGLSTLIALLGGALQIGMILLGGEGGDLWHLLRFYILPAVFPSLF